MTKFIVVANQKGGVGKTTTAVNLSAALGTFDKRILLVDLDPQANCTSGVGIDKNKIDKQIYGLLLGDGDIYSAIIPTEISNLKIIPSNIDLIGAEVELLSFPDKERRLGKVFDKIDNKFDYVIVDCPPALNILTINALVACNNLLIPIQCEYYALEGIVQLLKTIRLIQKGINRNLSIFGILLTMYDRRLLLSEQVAKEVRRFFGDKVFHTIIDRNVKLSEAPGFGKSILSYDINSRGAQNYLKLAMEILSRTIC
ncbi:MAG: ParA family protein [Candidatus Cloacimonetes bacterium]|nr:ParA family protein [Candidatus Cloacimonadota bacterium]